MLLTSLETATLECNFWIETFWLKSLLLLLKFFVVVFWENPLLMYVWLLDVRIAFELILLSVISEEQFAIVASTERDDRFRDNFEDRYSFRSTLEAMSDAFDAAPLILRRVLPPVWLFLRFRWNRIEADADVTLPLATPVVSLLHTFNIANTAIKHFLLCPKEIICDFL